MHKFELSTYKNIIANHRVINSDDIGYKWVVHIPENVAQHSHLYDVKQTLPSTDKGSIPYQGMITRDCMRPWLDILTEWLDTKCGKHVYQFAFVNTITDETFYLYFSYTIQEDNPEQDYVYMKRDD